MTNYDYDLYAYRAGYAQGKAEAERSELRDLIERLEGAERRLRVMADDVTHRGEVTDAAIRLRGKADGVQLALSYVREIAQPSPPLVAAVPVHQQED